MQNRIGRRLPFIAGYIIMTSCMYVIGGLAFGQGSQMKWAQAGVLLTWFAFYGLTVSLAAATSDIVRRGVSL
jgi:hypothetical protein